MDRKQLLTTPRARLEARRKAVFQALAGDAMILTAAPIQFASRDSDRAYRPDSELFYLTGVTDPDAVAVFVGGDEPGWTLFVAPRDADAELWAGVRAGPEGARERFGPTRCLPITELEVRLPELVSKAGRLHYRLGSDERVGRSVMACLERSRGRGARTGTGPRAVVDPGGILDELRLVKDTHEIGRIRQAAALTLAGHRAAARAVRPGAWEWEIQAELEATFLRGGGAAGFGTIVGSGPNACVLHYRANDTQIAEGDLVLLDAGAELGLYHGDVTRTYPASGRFTGAQRRIYELVDAARRSAIEAVRPGAAVAAVHDAAVHTLVEGLHDLGILDGGVDEAIGSEAYKPYFPHQTSHWLGLDVHDPGDYARGGEPRELVPGMVLTVEPGLYFRDEASAATEPYRGIGVRLEDDVLVTETGHENLTLALPTAPDDIEKLMDDIR